MDSPFTPDPSFNVPPEATSVKPPPTLEGGGAEPSLPFPPQPAEVMSEKSRQATRKNRVGECCVNISLEFLAIDSPIPTDER